MAIYPGTERIIDAARTWRDECLRASGSILSSSRLWTLENFEELEREYVEKPDLGSGSFLGKLCDQLAVASSEAKMLVAEAHWLMYLFPTNISGEKKVENVRTVWNWSETPFPEDHALIRLLLEVPGIGSGGQGFLTYQWKELSYLITALQDWKARSDEDQDRLCQDPWGFAGWLDGFPKKGARQMRHMLRHLLFPEHFERIASGRQKRAIAKAYEVDVPELVIPEDDPSLVRVDRKILAVRERLQERYGGQRLDFYEPPLVERWDPKENIEEIILPKGRMEELKAAFLKRYPGFQDFEEPSPEFHQGERDYKDELAEEFGRRFNQAPEIGDLDSRLAARVVEDIQEVLKRTLSAIGRPQNLLSWRYFEFLRHLKPDEKDTFARAFLDLLFGEGPSAERVGRFNQQIWPLLERTNSATPALTRSFPTLFLMLQNPEGDIFIRTDLFDRFTKHVRDEALFTAKPLDPGEYRKALSLARAVESELQGWGWKPQDMIDVQSFMWTADSQLQAESRGKTPGSRKGNGQIPENPFTDLLHQLTGKGLQFPSEVIANYVLALQTKRFVILTGISGTGKTRLAIDVARFLGEDEEGGAGGSRYEVIAVRPDWTDNRGLLGYYNPITDAYVPTQFLRLLLRARQEKMEADQEERAPLPFFAVLDEMNLARVEHYFSDFLSAMESGEALNLHHHGSVEVTLEGERWMIPEDLHVPENVFFTGTVNVDETTYMFSPKVLDRAFTIELSQVDLRTFGESWDSGGGDKESLTLSNIPIPLRMERRPGAEDWRLLREIEGGDLRRMVEELNDLLEDSGRHFGYRVAAEIARFVTLGEAQNSAGASPARAALDLAILQKVLPKFHGTQQEVEGPLLRLLAFSIWGEFQKAKDPPHHLTAGWTLEGGRLVPRHAVEEGQPRPRLPRTGAKILRMLRRLPARGFTSFIE
jgi:hypothetical protein